MSVHFSCPAGHRLKASERMRGKTLPCPACGRKVRVPAAPATPLTDASVMQMLGTAEVEPALPEKPTAPATRICPHCHAVIAATAKTCDACQRYVEISANTWATALRHTTPPPTGGHTPESRPQIGG